VTAQPTEVPIQVEDLLLRLPRQSENRAFVEGLKNHYEQVVFINFVAHKFGLSTVDVCRLLDEEAMFWPDGTLDEDQFQKEASLLYKQSAKQTEKRQLQTGVRTEGEANEAEVSELFQEEPPQPIAQQMNREQYNFLMRNQPYTQFLKLFFPGTIPDLVDKLFIRLDVNYKLRNEVINVLIHYLKAQDLSWNKSFVETIAADMLGKQIDTFEKAVGYIREQQKFKTRKPAERSGYSGKTNGRTRPQIPVAESSGEPTVSEEEYMQILKKYQLIEGDGE
jgi:replication initiation and membrane attachment protein